MKKTFYRAILLSLLPLTVIITIIIGDDKLVDTKYFKLLEEIAYRT